MQSASGLVTNLRKKNFAAYISGSGPSVCILTNKEKVEEVISLVPEDFEAQQLNRGHYGLPVYVYFPIKDGTIFNYELQYRLPSSMK